MGRGRQHPQGCGSERRTDCGDPDRGLSVMNHRAAIACLLVVSSPLAIAAQQTQTKAAQADPAASTRARVEAVHGQVQAEDVNVRQLKARVDALEADSQAASR